jgi:hypothetical protein
MAPKKKAVREKDAPKDEPSMDLQAVHDASVGGDIVGNGHTVLGMTLRPVTLETIVLLKQVDSPLILGVAMEKIPNIFLDCCIFIVLQSGEVKDARRLAWSPTMLREAALDMASSVPAKDFSTVTDSINSILRDATSTSVEAKPPKGSKNDDPLGNS